MHTKVKICGITKLSEVEFLNEMDVDYIGFVFAKSKRKVSVEDAAKLSNAFRKNVKKVGVFVESSISEINDIASKVGLDIAQVHKNYSPQMIKDINIPVWYAQNIKDRASVDAANEADRYSNVTGIVADSYVKGQEGGTGKAFNWDLLNYLDDDIKLILAGGLNASNIKEAIEKTKPYAVDISSGVEETIDGKLQKSRSKVFEFIRKVKENG